MWTDERIEHEVKAVAVYCDDADADWLWRRVYLVGSAEAITLLRKMRQDLAAQMVALVERLLDEADREQRPYVASPDGNRATIDPRLFCHCLRNAGNGRQQFVRRLREELGIVQVKGG